MKVVIAGVGQVGWYLAKMLNTKDHDVIVIDEDRDKLMELSSTLDLMVVHGSATSIEILNEADIANADLFIAVTQSQEVNIISSILAKKLGANKTIARIDNNEYVQPEYQKIITQMGIDSLVYPEILASEEIVNIIKNPGILKSIEFASGRLVLFSYKVKKDSKIIGKTLIELTKEHSDLKARVVAINRRSKTIIPRGEDTIHAGDIIYVLTDKKSLDRVYEVLNIKKFQVTNIMILGGSRIGINTAKALEKCCYVKLFEKDREKSLQIADMLKNTLVINAEARDAEFLIDEGIERVDAFIAVTGNSEINILSSLLAKRLGVKMAIAEVENTDYLELAKSMDLDYIINKKLVAASHIFTFTIGTKVESVQGFTETEAEVLEFVVKEGAKITGKPLKQLDFPKGAIIGGGERNGDVFIAVGDTVIQPGDRVVVFALPDVIDKVVKFFK